MKKPTLLIDLDGTLLASRKMRLHAHFLLEATQFLRREQGVSALQALKLLRAIRRAIESTEASDFNEIRAATVFAQIRGLSVTEARILLRRMVLTVFPKMKSYFYPIAGSAEFIQWAGANFHLVLATNPVWPLEVVKLRMSWGTVKPDHFQLITNAEIMHTAKPHLSYYSELLQKLNLEPANTIMIGDSEKKDLPAARLGLPVFLLREENREINPGKVWQGDFSYLQKILEEKSNGLFAGYHRP